jgi:hypothetical protein
MERVYYCNSDFESLRRSRREHNIREFFLDLCFAGPVDALPC